MAWKGGGSRTVDEKEALPPADVMAKAAKIAAMVTEGSTFWGGGDGNGLSPS